MPLQHLHRILVIIPANRCTLVNNFIRQSGIDPTGSDWFVANLSASGNTPATHAWAYFSSNNLNLRRWKSRICLMGSITEPSNETWDSWTRAEKKQWFLNQRETIWTNIGVWIEVTEAEGQSINSTAVLAARNLQRIVQPIL